MTKNTIFLMILATSLITSEAMAKEKAGGTPSSVVKLRQKWVKCTADFQESTTAYYNVLKKRYESLGGEDEPLNVELCWTMITSELKITHLGDRCIDLGTKTLRSGLAAVLIPLTAETIENIRDAVNKNLALIGEQLAVCERLPGAPKHWFY